AARVPLPRAEIDERVAPLREHEEARGRRSERPRAQNAAIVERGAEGGFVEHCSRELTLARSTSLVVVLPLEKRRHSRIRARPPHEHDADRAQPCKPNPAERNVEGALAVRGRTRKEKRRDRD